MCPASYRLQRLSPHMRQCHISTPSTAKCGIANPSAYINGVTAGEDQNEIAPVASFGPSGTNTPTTASQTPRSQTPAQEDLKQALPAPPTR